MADPTLPAVPITINGTEYKMCFDLNAIADVEEELLRKGVSVNLLEARWGALTAASTRALFVASLRVYHSDLDMAEARQLYAAAPVEAVVLAIGETYRKFAPDPVQGEGGEENPIQPGS